MKSQYTYDNQTDTGKAVHFLLLIRFSYWLLAFTLEKLMHKEWSTKMIISANKLILAVFGESVKKLGIKKNNHPFSLKKLRRNDRQTLPVPVSGIPFQAIMNDVECSYLL